jgi:hypothetical protein
MSSGGGERNLLGLPNEIWIKILSNLCPENTFKSSHVSMTNLLNASLVSKKLRELALDPVLWTELALNNYSSLLIYTPERCRGRDLQSLTSFHLTAKLYSKA